MVTGSEITIDIMAGLGVEIHNFMTDFKDINASVQKFACKMATHNWYASYQELLTLCN